ncbi:MAG: autotransporter-associated beta strand repeat-containing protein, partial [Phycisphaerales bacterium]|nr:autotransporter-associated beta strand repeat-containing protein [Phycisphaerales bacterium]
LFAGDPLVPTSPLGFTYSGVLGPGELHDTSGVDHGDHGVYLAGGEMRMSSTSGPLRTIGALAGASTLSASSPWALDPAAEVIIAPGASLRSSSSFRATWPDVHVTNDGTFSIDQGTIASSGHLDGSGTLVLGTFGNQTTALLELSNGAMVENAIDFRGRTTGAAAIVNASEWNEIRNTLTLGVGGTDYILRSDGGVLDITGGAVRAFHTGPNMGARTITFDGEGDGYVRRLIDNALGTNVSVRKTGSGTWALLGGHRYGGTTDVDGGTLIISGPGGHGDTSVHDNATLAGRGPIRGDLIAWPGSTIRAGDDGLTDDGAGPFDVLETFEAYAAGPIGATPNGTGDTWLGVPDGTDLAQIIAEGGSRSMGVRGTSVAGGWRGVVADLGSSFASDARIDPGEQVTVFFRLKRTGTGAVHTVIGLSDQGLSGPPGHDVTSPYNEYAVTLSLFGDTGNTVLRAYSGSVAQVELTPVQTDEWINVWLFIDHSTETFQVATSTGLDDGVEFGTAFDFGRRVGSVVSSNPLVTFGWHGLYGVTTELDDLHLSPGFETSNPLGPSAFVGETLSVLGDLLLSEGGRLRLEIADSTRHDRVEVAGTLMAAGPLDVAVHPSFAGVAFDDVVLLPEASS